MRRAPVRALAWRTAALFVMTVLIVSAAVTPSSSVAGPVLVHDFVQTPAPSNPYRSVVFGGAVYFALAEGETN